MAGKQSNSDNVSSTPTPTEPVTTQPVQPEPVQPVQPVQPVTWKQPAVATPPVEIDYRTGRPVQPNATPAVTGEQPGQQPPAEPTATTGKVMTQQEIDAIINARLERERAKYADYEQTKAKLKEFEDKDKTESEKQTARMAELEERDRRLQTELTETRLQTAVYAEASKLGLDPEAAYRLVDLTALTLKDDGKVDGASAAVKAVAERYPGLLKTVIPATPVTNPARSSEPVGRTDADRRREYFTGGASPFWGGGGVRLPASLNEE